MTQNEHIVANTNVQDDLMKKQRRKAANQRGQWWLPRTVVKPFCNAPDLNYCIYDELILANDVYFNFNESTA